jgi:aerobic carbon-monoxide dehydrogenase medium subunit
VIPAEFEYVRAASAADASAALAADPDAKLLAGGHSLLPLMKLRLATPSLLVDIGRLDELRYVRRDGDELAIGALTRHRALETDPLVRRQAGLLAAAAAEVGDPQVRHRGTIGGSVAHGDPASDLPAVLLALDASYLLTGPAGQRTVPASEFHLGFLETALAPDEILTEIRVPAGAERYVFKKFRGRAIDWAVVGVAAVTAAAATTAAATTAAATTGAGVRVALVNMAATPVRARAVEAALAAGEPAGQAARLAAEGTEPPSDLNASAGFRCHLARVLTARALADLGVAA